METKKRKKRKLYSGDYFTIVMLCEIALFIIMLFAVIWVDNREALSIMSKIIWTDVLLFAVTTIAYLSNE